LILFTLVGVMVWCGCLYANVSLVARGQVSHGLGVEHIYYGGAGWLVIFRAAEVRLLGGVCGDV